MSDVKIGSFANNASQDLAEDILDLIYETSSERHLNLVEVIGVLELAKLQLIEDIKADYLEND